jgi:hypothetical protein
MAETRASGITALSAGLDSVGARRASGGVRCVLVLHGFWSLHDGLRLWGEDSERAVKSPSQAVRSARPHPFAVPADEVAQVHSGKPGTVTLLLPSLRTAPLDSPELLRVTPRPQASSEPTLLPWTVPVVTLEPPVALAALEHAAEGVRYGASLTFLASVASFARELTTRGGWSRPFSVSLAEAWPGGGRSCKARTSRRCMPWLQRCRRYLVPSRGARMRTRS